MWWRKRKHNQLIQLHEHTWKSGIQRVGTTLLNYHVCDCGVKEFNFFFPLLSTESLGQTPEQYRKYVKQVEQMARDLYHKRVDQGGCVGLGEEDLPTWST